MKLLDYILARLGENSTWRGLTLLITSLGITLRPEEANAIAAVGLAIVGAVNVVRKQK